MIRMILLTLAFLVSIYMYPQKRISTDFKYRVTYDLTYSMDSTNLDSKKSEDMILFLGDGISSFSSKAKLVGNKIVVKGNTAHTSPAAITDFDYMIIKNFKQDYLSYTREIVQDYFYFNQDLDLFDWTLHEETKVINDYKVQKATMSYSGRDYIAWFTHEIPISDGPYKFNGLPGLILEISDTENHYNFTLKGLEKLHPEIPFKLNFKHYVKTSEEELFEVYSRFRRDPVSYININTTLPNFKISQSPEAKQHHLKRFAEEDARKNNHIEKKWYR